MSEIRSVGNCECTLQTIIQYVVMMALYTPNGLNERETIKTEFNFKKVTNKLA